MSAAVATFGGWGAAYPRWLDHHRPRYGAHGMRAGFVTEVFRTGHEPTTIMKRTGHKSVESLLNYARDNNIHVQNAATTIGM